VTVIPDQTQAAVALMATSPAQSVGQRDVVAIRAELHAGAVAARADGPRADGVRFTDYSLADGVVVRVFRPAGDASSRPPILFVHGGGWAICDIDTHHELTAQLCADTGAIVASVDYRLAPEYPYPVPLHDCLAAARWLAESATELSAAPNGIVVVGDSSGANLAAAVALASAADHSLPRVLLQVLLYPVLAADFDTASYRSFGDGSFGLSEQQMRWYWEAYAPGPERDDPLAAPGRASDLAGVASAFIGVGEFDPLLDEARAYAQALEAAGVAVEFREYGGGFHGFYSFRGLLDIAADAAADVARAVAAVAG
jgi:acetyl esterase